MTRTVFSLSKMDCAAEEQLVRMALKGRPNVREIRVNLGAREVTVSHQSDPLAILAVLIPLNLEARLVKSENAEVDELLEDMRTEVPTLKIVLAINAGMFVAEAIGAWAADSSALLADSLDMFADAAVYGIALYGATRAVRAQARAAFLSGVLQLLLALGAFTEVIRRVVVGSDPEGPLMIGVGAAALGANVICLWLLARHRESGAHMKASWIFTTNDVLANLGVMAAAVLVGVFDSSVPDLVVASVIAAIVLRGALRILRIARSES